jgi:hypothetical protein
MNKIDEFTLIYIDAEDYDVSLIENSLIKLYNEFFKEEKFNKIIMVNSNKPVNKNNCIYYTTKYQVNINNIFISIYNSVVKNYKTKSLQQNFFVKSYLTIDELTNISYDNIALKRILEYINLIKTELTEYNKWANNLACKNN